MVSVCWRITSWKSTGGVDSTPISTAHTAQHCTIMRLVSHVSSSVVSFAFHHEHFIFLIHSTFYDTRTRSRISITRATPRTLRRRRETLSKTSLSRTTADWLEPRHTTPTRCEQSYCVEKPGDTQGLESTDCWILRETWRKIRTKFQSRRSVEFSRMAKGCSTGFEHRWTCSDRLRPEVPESSGENLNWGTSSICHREYPVDSKTSEDSEDSEPESWIWPHHFHVSPDCVPHMKRVFSKPDRWPEWPRCEYSGMGFICVCHATICISSKTILFGKPTIYLESTLEVCETILSDNWKVDQSSGGDHRFVHDWLEPVYVERIISTVW